MKQQLLEMRMAEVEAVARKALQDGDHQAAIARIIKIVERKS